MEKLVILDADLVSHGDLNWDDLAKIVDLKIYPATQQGEMIEHIGDATMVMSNSCRYKAELLDACPNLRYIGQLSTGFNLIDTAYARSKGISVTNVPAYSTDSVAQLVFALLLEVCHHVGQHSDLVRAGRWTKNQDFSFWDLPLIELAGKTMGVWGYGAIGKTVARIATAFGMTVLANSRSRQFGSEDGVEFVSIDQLLSESDVLSLHIPLSAETRGLVNKDSIAKMRDGVIIINTSRGPIVEDEDIIAALESGKVAWYATDVLAKEPPPADFPLLRAPNTIITPHIAWAPLAARLRLRDVAVDNVKAYLSGNPINVVN